MALTDEGGTNMVLPVTPMGNTGNGFGGDWSSWIILFLIFGMFGGWGGNGFGGFGGDGLYPWMNNSQNINNGFRDQMLNDNISGIRDNVFGISNQLCNGFAGVNASIVGAQNGITQQMYANQLADLERSFAAQTANMQGMNAIQSQIAQCCCDNKSASLENRYVVATEACATRTADAQNTNAILNALNSGVQSIKDQLCADKIESKNDIISQLRSELLYARGQASQDVQTAAIQAGQRALANEVEQYVAPRPIPSYTVTSPYCCNTYNGCGCGA